MSPPDRSDASDAALGGVLNVTTLIDQRPIGGYQIWVTVLCGLIALLDGIDSQSIGVAAPAIAKALQFPISHFGPVFSVMLFGATIGALGFGPLADRFGRKWLLTVATLFFAVFTFLTALADSYSSLMVYRFFAGLGLGGATPCFIALTSEYAPRRHRGALVSAMWAAFPLGGMLGGFLNSLIIARFGWQAIFYIGGFLPLLSALALAVSMPESLRFLFARGRAATHVGRIVAKLAPDLLHNGTLTPSTRFIADEEAVSGSSVLHLFSDGRALATLLLWVPFFMAFADLIVVTLWTPALLRANGISLSATAFVVAFNGLGGFIGMAIAGRLMDRYGMVATLVPAFLLGAVSTVGLGYGMTSVPMAATFMGLVGLFVGFGGSGAIALSAMLYPTAMRSTGIGWGMGMGRLGQVFGPLIAGIMLGFGLQAPQIMLVIGAGPLIAAFFVLLLRAQLRARPALAAASTAAE